MEYLLRVCTQGTGGAYGGEQCVAQLLTGIRRAGGLTQLGALLRKLFYGLLRAGPGEARPGRLFYQLLGPPIGGKVPGNACACPKMWGWRRIIFLQTPS